MREAISAVINESMSLTYLAVDKNIYDISAKFLEQNKVLISHPEPACIDMDTTIFEFNGNV